MKYSAIVKVYIEAADKLRNAGLKAPIVFALSKIKEYYVTNTRCLHGDIVDDLMSTPQLGSAKHSVKL